MAARPETSVFQKVQSKSLWIMFILSVIYVLVFLTFDFFNNKHAIEVEKQTVREQVVHVFEAEKNKLVSFYSTRIECHLAAPEVVEAMQNRDHQAIYDSAKPKFDLLNKKNPYVTHMHFYAPDGTSLMRVHNKEVYGDNIAAKRPMVAYAVQNQIAVSGFEEGYFGLIFRVIGPAFNAEGEYIGSLEFGFQPEYFEKIIKDLFPDIKVALTVPKSTLKIYQDSGRFESYKDYYLIGDDRELIKSFLDSPSSNVANQTVTLDDKPYLLIDDIQLKDFDGKPFINMILLKNLEPLYAKFYSAIKQNMFMGVLLLIVMWLASRYALNYFSENATRLHNRLEQSHAKMEAIFNTSSEGLALIDYQGNFVEVNPAFCKMLQYNAPQLKGHSLKEFLAAQSLQEFEVCIKQVHSEERIEKTEQWYTTQSGTQILLEVSMATLEGEEHILLTCRDITQIRRQQQEIENYVNVLDENVVTSKTDIDGFINYASKAFCDISGYSKDELMGKNHSIVRHADMPIEVYEDMWDTITSGRVWRGEIKNRNKNGSSYWVQATISPEFDDVGQIVGYTAVRHDITDKKRVEELSITDELTGLYNRRYYNEVFNQLFNSRKRDLLPFLFVLIDVDYFKKYNDTYGHHAGDLALQGVSSALKADFQRNGDYLFRLGGEEFGAILHVDSESDVHFLLERIHKSIAKLDIQHEQSKVSNRLTVSVGACLVSCYDKELDDIAVYKQADAALYKSKEQGRNQSVLMVL